MLSIGWSHLGVHIVTIILSFVLLGLACASYYRERGRRLALVCAAFALFAIQQVLTLVDVVWLGHRLMVQLHVLSFIIVLFFFFGLMYND